MSDPAEHSIIACSSAEVWGAPDGCPGSVTAALMYPELEPTPESLEGDAIHLCASVTIEQGLLGRTTATCAQQVGANTTDGVVITEEMAEVAQVYVDDVATVLSCVNISDVTSYGFEQRVSASDRIHEQSYGTPDGWIFDRARGYLYAWDLKGGRRWVDEYRNWQLITYVAGILQSLGIDPSAERHISVHMRIVQPRAYGPGGIVREWVVPCTELRQMWGVLAKNAADALSISPTYRSGPHCRDCPARGGNCVTAIRGGMSLYEASTNKMPRSVSPQEVGTLLQIVETAKERLSDIESGLVAQAEHFMEAGQTVPGRIVEAVHSRLAWGRPDTDIIALGLELNISLEKQEQPGHAVTPTQAIKLGIDSDIINKYCKPRQLRERVAKDKHKQAQRLFNR